MAGLSNPGEEGLVEEGVEEEEEEEESESEGSSDGEGRSTWVELGSNRG